MQEKLSLEEIKTVFKGLELSRGEWTYLIDKFKKITLKKGELLLQAGSYLDSIYYLYSGCMRAFYLDEQGKDHTFQFAIEDWWISDYNALFKRERTVINIEAIQETVVFLLNMDDFEEMCNKIREVEAFHRRKMQGAFASFQRRILENLSKPAKERYLSFLKNYVEIEKNVKNYHIASFLGITSESLSRIRKELSSENID